MRWRPLGVSTTPLSAPGSSAKAAASKLLSSSPRAKGLSWPSLADAHFILGEVDIDGDEQTISRDELRAAVNLWRRLIAETTPSQSDQLKMHGRMGLSCEVM